MNHEIRVGVDYRAAAIGPIKNAVDRSIGQVFKPPEIAISADLSLPERIYESFEKLDPRFRNGDPLPIDTIIDGVEYLNRTTNMQIVAQAVDRGEPIPVGIVIGTLLNPSARFPEHEKAGLLGALAVERLLEMDRNVRRIYPEGLKEVIVADDFVSHWLFDYTSSYDAVEAAQGNFLASMQGTIDKMQDAYGVSPIRVVRESEMYVEQGISFEEYREICEENTRALEAYLAESDGIIKHQEQKGKTWKEYEEEIKKLSSFRELDRLGWKGTVPPVMRDYYRERVLRSHQDLPEDLIDAQVARLFASSLTKGQKRVVQKAFDGATHLRFGFIPQPPGIDKTLQTIIQISAHPRSKSYSVNDTTPPWRGIAHISYKPDKAGLRIRKPDGVDVEQIPGVFFE